LKLDEDRVRQTRERLGLTLSMVAQKAGTSKNTVLSAEHGGDIRPTTARKIAEALNVEIADLMGEPEGPLAVAPSSQEKLFNNGVLEEERRHPSLRNWTALINGFADRWGQEITERENEWQAAKPAIRKHVKLLPNLSWANEVRYTASDVIGAANEQLEAAILDIHNSEEALELFKSVKRLEEVLERTDSWYRRDAEDAPKVAEVVDIRAGVERMKRQIGSQAS
jgi:transcriptional regulator with XRE-family HTH domain